MTITVAIGLYFLKHIIAHLNCFEKKKIYNIRTYACDFRLIKSEIQGYADRHLVLIGAL